MEELTPQERFNQLKSFLKDPDKHTFTRTGDKRNFPIASMAFPDLNLGDIVFLPGRKHSAGLVNEFRQEAIEIMDSAMFRNGRLRGNQKTDDIKIEHIEEFVLPMAAVIDVARGYIAKSLAVVRSHTFDGQLNVYDELKTAWADLMIAFDKVASLELEGRHIQRLVGLNPQKRAAFNAQIKKLVEEGKDEEIDRILKESPAGIRGELFVLRAKSLDKAHHKEIKKLEKPSFDPIAGLIHIFLSNVPQASDYLIRNHIYDFVSERQHSSLKGLNLPGRDALRQEVKKQRRLAATTKNQ